MLLPFLVGAVLLVALYLLYGALKSYNYHELVAGVKSYSVAAIIIALALTAVNYLILSFYDVLAFRYVEKDLPYRKIAFTSFMSYVFSYNIGLSLFGSSALRYRFYSSWGLEGGTIAKIVAFCVSTFWIGLAVMGGGSLLLAPPAISSLPVLTASSRLIGVLLLLAVAGYLAACLAGKTELRIKSFILKLPRFRIALMQTVVASLDWFLAGMVLYSLLPAGRPDFLPFIAVFATAQLVGATSHVPGGVGVFETLIILSLSSYIPSGSLLSALIVYRGIYYLTPLTVAILAFAIREAYTARRGIGSTVKRASKVVAPFLPTMLSLAVFLSGIVLLFSGATPAIMDRLLMLDPFIPIEILEFSHFAASLTGLALLVIADGIRRRVDVAYYLALILLALGAVSSLLKGLDWEEALVLSTVLLLIIPSRHLFYRHAALLSPPSFLQWSIAVGTVLAVTTWLGFFSYKHVQYSGDLWWMFELQKNAPRFLRASLGVGIGAVVIALRALLAPVPRMKHESLADCEGDVRRILAAARSSNANLALLGDKYFHFSQKRNAFLMYGESGRTVVVMGDPVGDESEFPDLLWEFYELTRRQGVRAVWYEISAEHLTVFVELGVRILKIGEEAVVDLESFTLDGAKGSRLRPPRNKLRREGYSFEVLEPSAIAARTPEIKAVSDQWLTAKKSKEKGFSLGYFDEAYLSNFPCAVVTRENRIVAFANLWPGGANRELSLDLMRHTDDAPGGSMEFLFVECLLWAKANGYQKFNLGMAPLSGLESREAAPLWNKVVTLIFQNGEGIYNFQGLRAFKDKFGPQWLAVYIAVSAKAGSAALPVIATDIAQLVSRGKAPARHAHTAPVDATT